MVNYGVISLLQISSRNRFQEFESHKRINLIPFLTSSSYFLLQNSLYCAYNADFFPLRTRRFISHADSSHSIPLILNWPLSVQAKLHIK